jgi:hypothetical protein
MRMTITPIGYCHRRGLSTPGSSLSDIRLLRIERQNEADGEGEVVDRAESERMLILERK